MHKFTEEEKEWARKLVKPDLPEYDDKDHEIAALRFLYTKLRDELVNLKFSSHRFQTADEMRNEIHQLLYGEKKFGSIGNRTTLEKLEELADNHGWKAIKREHLHGHHCGDCTAVACSCDKCEAEEYYKFQTPYEGKSAGWKALHIYRQTFVDSEPKVG
jgi:hypothetical protein